MDKVMVTVDVIRYTDGQRVGSTEIAEQEWERYVDCTHTAYHWPEGLAEAGDVLTDEEIEAMGIAPKTVIWLEE